VHFSQYEELKAVLLDDRFDGIDVRFFLGGGGSVGVAAALVARLISSMPRGP
jgi:hypothetical protein